MRRLSRVRRTQTAVQRRIVRPDWSTSVYEHLRYPEITVAETFRLLRPGGASYT